MNRNELKSWWKSWRSLGRNCPSTSWLRKRNPTRSISLQASEEEEAKSSHLTREVEALKEKIHEYMGTEESICRFKTDHTTLQRKLTQQEVRNKELGREMESLTRELERYRRFSKSLRPGMNGRRFSDLQVSTKEVQTDPTDSLSPNYKNLAPLERALVNGKLYVESDPEDEVNYNEINLTKCSPSLINNLNNNMRRVRGPFLKPRESQHPINGKMSARQNGNPVQQGDVFLAHSPGQPLHIKVTPWPWAQHGNSRDHKSHHRERPVLYKHSGHPDKRRPSKTAHHDPPELTNLTFQQAQGFSSSSGESMQPRHAQSLHVTAHHSSLFANSSFWVLRIGDPGPSHVAHSDRVRYHRKPWPVGAGGACGRSYGFPREPERQKQLATAEVQQLKSKCHYHWRQQNPYSLREPLHSSRKHHSQIYPLLLPRARAKESSANQRHSSQRQQQNHKQHRDKAHIQSDLTTLTNYSK